ncbi:MAG: glucose-6-phosphate isomerase [Pseudomonadota bacterium]
MKLSVSLGRYQSVVDAACARMMKDRVPDRIRQKDYTLWKSAPEEITNRLGWLHSPRSMTGRLAQINGLVDAVRNDGYTHALLLGMGGSSLAPAVFRKIFGVSEDYLDLAVLDSTDPGAVLTFSEQRDLAKTLFIVSTKSGGTVETFSFMKYFFNLLSERYGAQEAGRHFIAITDPGSALAELAAVHRFRETFLNDPEIGGRYSALSCFGLVPAALVGVDVKKLLNRAAESADQEKSLHDFGADSLTGLYLGAVMGELARAGRDKLTFVFSTRIASFGDWLEQLIAESTGKERKGILPVVGELLGLPEVYGDDRFFVCMQLAGDEAQDEAVAHLEKAGQPIIRIGLQDVCDLSGQIYIWEMATAVAGHILGINPFDQPDVEAAKVLTRKMIVQYREKGSLPDEAPFLRSEGIAVYGDCPAHSPGDALNVFLGSALPNGYVALQAYLQPTAETDAALLRLRSVLCDRCRLATTTGYGPRFLHSTGQLHKGDGGGGMFIQFTADDRRDVPIPDDMGQPGSSLSFGVLKAAQALGDGQALRNAGRPVIRFHLGDDISGGLEVLTQAVFNFF